LLVVFGAFVVIASAFGFFIWGVTKGPNLAGAIFGGIQAIVSLLALIAGVAALVISLGPFLEWQRERFRTADVQMLLGAGPGSGINRRLPPLKEEYIGFELDVLFSVSLSNRSSFNVRTAMVNVVVPSTCKLQRYPVGDHDDRIRFPAVLSTNSELIPDQTVEVRYATAGLELMTPGNWYSFAMQVNLPRPGRWPLLISISTPNGSLSRLCHLSVRNSANDDIPEPDVVTISDVSPQDVVSTTN